jgi:xanthine/uracil permease
VVSATGYEYTPSSGRNPNADVAAGGILICGIVYGCIGLIVLFAGSGWIEYVMPPGKKKKKFYMSRSRNGVINDF